METPLLVKVLGVVILGVVLSLFSNPDNLEKLLSRMRTNANVISGLLLLIAELVLFSFSKTEVLQGKFILGWELVFRYHLISAMAIFLLSILAIAVILINKLVDRFRYATLFVIINCASYFVLVLFEAPKRFIYMPFPPASSCGTLGGLAFFILLILIMIFGLESNKTEPKNSFFKLIRRIGAKIEKDYSKKD